MKKGMVLFIGMVIMVGLFFPYDDGLKVIGSQKTDWMNPDGKIKTNQPRLQARSILSAIPLHFIQNKGQMNPKARFYAKTSAYTLWITNDGLVFDSFKNEGEKAKGSPDHPQLVPGQGSQSSGKSNRDVSRFMFVGARKDAQIVMEQQAKLKVNYFKGNDPSRWMGDVLTSLAVRYNNLFDSIDLKVYGVEKQIEYDWIIKPGGNPEAIRFAYQDVKKTSIDREGDLVINTQFGQIKHKKPLAYQIINGKKVIIDSKFREINKLKKVYGFQIGRYDRAQNLIIDPVCLAYSTYLGGNGADYGRSIAVDSAGYVYITGYTESSNFPTLNQYQGNQSYTDTFLTKIDTSQSGSSCLLYSSYFGGDGFDYGYGIDVDSNGIAYITGRTGSSNFPTLNQYQTDQENDDGFITKIDTTQSGSSSLLYSTYLGGSGSDYCNDIVIDGSGHAYVTGTTLSTDFPILNQYQTDQSSSDAFVTQLDTTQSGSNCLVYSTYLGGSYDDYGSGIALDSSGYVYIIGETNSSNFPTLNQYQGDQGVRDVVVSKLDTSQSGSSSLLYSTYIGGSGEDCGRDIAVGGSGNAFITGSTQSTDFPTKNQYQSYPGNSYEHAFLTRIDTTQSGSSSLIYATYLGGNNMDRGNGIIVDSNGYAFITGYTYSTNFPTLDPHQTDPGDSNGDAFLTKMDTDQTGSSSLIYSTYLGGSADDGGYGIAVNGILVHICGQTDSTDFTTARQYQTDQIVTDAFITTLYHSSETLAAVSDFSVVAEGGQAVVQWETASEAGTVGFYVLRKGEKDHVYQPVNPRMLTALLNSPQGGFYRMADPGVVIGETCSYKLVEVESRGLRRTYGPYQVTVGQTEVTKIQQRPIPFKPAPPMFGSYAKTSRDMNPVKKARINAIKKARQRFHLFRMQRVKGEGKIIVKEAGLYYINSQDIGNVLGMSPHQVNLLIMMRGLALTNQGEEVPWIPAWDRPGICFYGKEIESVYTDENVYGLKKGKGLAMKVFPGGYPAPVLGQTFIDSLHIEKDKYTLTALFDDPLSDYWLWDFIITGEEGKTFPFDIHGVAQNGEAVLSIHLMGATATPHHAKIKLNGTEIGEGSWHGTDSYQFDLPFDPSILSEGSNIIEVIGILSEGTEYSIFYVDSFDLNYRRFYRAHLDRLDCPSEGNRVITVEGFSSRNIKVFEVTDPKRPILVIGSVIDPAGRVSFIPANPESRYLVIGEGAYNFPCSVFADSPSHLKRKNQSADYLIIVPDGFEEAAKDLVDLRRRSGLEPMVVSVEDIYDEFNHGLADPKAIKDFITYAAREWCRNDLKYVVLAGTGTYDYKDHLGYGENLIPPVMVSTPQGLFTADNWYVDIEGEDGIPEISIGRLPVATVEELRSYIGKLADYENASGEWTGRVLMMADNPDHGGDFPSDSKLLSGLVNGYGVDHVYLPEYASVIEARNALFDFFNRGVALINYLGHGGLDILCQERLLTVADVSSLQNGDRLPVLTAMTCVAGRFSLPGFETLAEALVLKDNGGVIASWAPTGASSNYYAAILTGELFKAVFNDGQKVLGRAILQSFRNFGENGGLRYMIDIYNLLGDPALTIK